MCSFSWHEIVAAAAAAVIGAGVTPCNSCEHSYSRWQYQIAVLS